jgi:hypothetical protein
MEQPSGLAQQLRRHPAESTLLELIGTLPLGAVPLSHLVTTDALHALAFQAALLTYCGVDAKDAFAQAAAAATFVPPPDPDPSSVGAQPVGAQQASHQPPLALAVAAAAAGGAGAQTASAHGSLLYLGKRRKLPPASAADQDDDDTRSASSASSEASHDANTEAPSPTAVFRTQIKTTNSNHASSVPSPRDVALPLRTKRQSSH